MLAKRTRIIRLFCSLFAFQNFWSDSQQSLLLAKSLSRESPCQRKLLEIRLFYRFTGFSLAERYKLVAAFDTIARLLLYTLSLLTGMMVFIRSTPITSNKTVFTKFITAPHMLLQSVTGITRCCNHYRVMKTLASRYLLHSLN